MATKTADTAVSTKTKGSKSTNPSKSDKSLDKANATKAAKDAVEAKAERDLKYIYPADMKTNSAKKKFRRDARAAYKRFQKAIAELEKSEDTKAPAELKAKRVEFNKFQQETYSHPAGK